MDSMRLTKGLLESFISKRISSIIFKKAGIKLDITINELDVKVLDGDAVIRLDARADGKLEDILEALNKM